MHLFVTLYEEPSLERRFGESYADYRRRLRRWLPRLEGGPAEGDRAGMEIRILAPRDAAALERCADEVFDAPIRRRDDDEGT